MAMTEGAGGLDKLPRARWFWLMLLLWLQCGLALPWLNEPLGDGRQHCHFDNAKFMRHALHSNFAPPGRWDARLLTGTATWEFSGDGAVTGPKFYARHPVLLPALFSLYVRVCGHGWWVPRSFMLLHLLPALAFLFLLLDATLRRSWLAALLTAGYALLPLNALMGIQWKYENGVVLWTLAAWWLALNPGCGPYWRRALYAVAVILPNTDWYAYAMLPVLLGYLASRRGEPGFSGLWWRVLLAMLAGAAVNGWLLARLLLDSDGNGRVLGWLADVPLASAGLAGWLDRQWVFLGYNFTPFARLLFAPVAAATALALLRVPGARRSALLWAAGGALLATVPWLLARAEAALGHHYYQWQFGLALILAMGWLLNHALERWPRRRRLLVAAVLLLLVGLSWQGLAGGRLARRAVRESSFGSAGDYAQLAVLANRLLVFSDGRSGPPDWWQGPVVALLQDQLWRNDGSRGGVALLNPIGSPDRDLELGLDCGRDLLVLINNEGAQRMAISDMRARFGPLIFRRRATSDNLVFLSFAPDLGLATDSAAGNQAHN